MYTATRSDASHNKAIGCSKVIVFCRPQFGDSIDCAPSGETHITVRLHGCLMSLILVRRVETSLAQCVKGYFWSCPGGSRDVGIPQSPSWRGNSVPSLRNVDRPSITGGHLMGATISIRYINVLYHIKVSAVDSHTGLIRWSQSVRRQLSCQAEMGRVVIVHVN